MTKKWIPKPLKMTRRFRFALLFLLLSTSLISFSCATAAPESARDTNSNREAREKMSDFDRELKALRTADFKFIFSIQRKDGGIFGSEDKRFVKRMTYKANRHTLTDDNKVIFVGSNYKFSDKNLNALKKRFDVEDFSKPEETPGPEKRADNKEEEPET